MVVVVKVTWNVPSMSKKKKKPLGIFQTSSITHRKCPSLSDTGRGWVCSFCFFPGGSEKQRNRVRNHFVVSENLQKKKKESTHSRHHFMRHWSFIHVYKHVYKLKVKFTSQQDMNTFQINLLKLLKCKQSSINALNVLVASAWVLTALCFC